jgi:dipeptidyl aminopeptidase/acylaminoacyl peptidase
VNGSWDIYAQRVGGRNATPIVNDPQRDEAGPAYSPDGSMIAFHESDDDGGIFIAGATGESVRRLTDAGFDPAWSPDGKHIAFGTEEVMDPASRLTNSFMYAVDTAGGARRQLVVVDVASRQRTVLNVRLPWPSTTDVFTISPDNRVIYYGAVHAEADIWIAERK